MSVNRRTLALLDGLRRQLDALLDTQVRDLVRAWAEAWTEVEADLNAALLEQLVAGERVSRAQLLRSRRLAKALTVIKDRLVTLADEAGVRIAADLQQIIDTAGAAQASVIDSQLPPGAVNMVQIDAWSRVDERQIEAIVRRVTEQITSTMRPIPAEQYQILRRELIRGVAAGTNPRATAARIVRRAEGRFNGGLTRALTIARTETLSAHREAALLGRTQHSDVLKGWRWLTQLDARTCPACLGMAGTFHAVDEPGPFGHQNCRCSAMPVTKSWAELGYSDIEEPADIFPEAKPWFEALATGEQRQVLGPKRFAAYQAGEFPMSAWATRRANPGWRDSYATAGVPKAARSSAA